MAYNILLSQRIDQLIKDKKGFTRREMFGGDSEGVKGNELEKWFELAFAFIKKLPPKK